MPEYAAVLLAGGRSSRMGRDKARLPHPASGLPLIAHQLSTLRAAGADPVLLSHRPEQDYPEVSATVPRVHDTGELGPLGALASAFAALASTPTARIAPTHLLALAVDMPRVSATSLRRLAAATRPDVGIVPQSATTGNYEPLCALYPFHTSCRSALGAALASGRLSLQGLVATGVSEQWMIPYPLQPDELSHFANWNSPQDMKPAT